MKKLTRCIWESRAFPGEPRVAQKETDEIEEDVGVERDKHLDMPASYVNEIQIHSLGMPLLPCRK